MNKRGIYIPILMLLFSSNMASAQVVEDGQIKADLAVDQDGDYIVVVQGLTDTQISELKALPGRDLIKLWVAGADQESIPPLGGKTGFVGDRLFFKSGFPLKPGLTYQVEITLPFDPHLDLSQPLTIPAEAVKPVVLETVFPTTNSVPENLLKFYLHFSGPMRKGDVYQFISLRERIDRDGQISFREIELPFLEIEQEFWSTDSTRLTLLLDPGRIKRGLKPREEMGPIFEADREYELVIDRNWPDANGNPLGAGTLPSGSQIGTLPHRFKTTKADYECPTPHKWRVRAPAANSAQPLELKFEESLDSAMLQRVINVFDPAGQIVAGGVRVSEAETVWKFQPKSDWAAGVYEIRIDNRLEDLCGNSIAKPFDVDVLENKPSGSHGVTVLGFQVR